MSRGAACGPPFGMGWDVESSCGPGMGFPLGCGSSLGLGCVTGLSGVNIVHVYNMVKGFVSLLGDNRDGLTTRGHPPLDPSTGLRVSGPTQGDHEGLPLRGRGWIPAPGGPG